MLAVSLARLAKRTQHQGPSFVVFLVGREGSRSVSSSLSGTLDEDVRDARASAVGRGGSSEAESASDLGRPLPPRRPPL